jgi:hypothetical protein
MTEKTIRQVIDELETKLLTDAQKVAKPKGKRKRTPARRKPQKG